MQYYAKLSCAPYEQSDFIYQKTSPYNSKAMAQSFWNITKQRQPPSHAHDKSQLKWHFGECLNRHLSRFDPLNTVKVPRSFVSNKESVRRDRWAAHEVDINNSYQQKALPK